MELFAVVVKQDGGILISEREYVLRFLNKQLTRESVQEYMDLFDNYAGPVLEEGNISQVNSPSVKDSVKILAICKKINRTLAREQKIVVLMRLYELINSDRKFSLHRMNIINTVSEVFRIEPLELESIEQFIRHDEYSELLNPSILYLGPENTKTPLAKRMISDYSGTRIIILRISSVDMYFIKFIPGEQLYLNGLPVKAHSIYSLPKGGSIKSLHGNAIYYGDITSCFMSEYNVHRISLVAENVTYRFKDGQTAVDNISFAASEGQLIGIIGASGSGKTTLMNIISGIINPTSGSVRINRLDVHHNSKDLEGVIGYVPQDDLLIEDLTVFENLFFAASQCFKNKSKHELSLIVEHTLANLGLLEKKDLKVGSPFNKMISGGQRKRLNIALELIREPSLLFVDEPTSGLSSRDSENLMDLLRDLSLKGKLIFTIIHQPSSEIYKMFDKILIMDKGGCMAFYGNPVDAVIYFKTLDYQTNAYVGECPSCGNVNSETILNILETQVVDEFGKYTEKRKVKPSEWAALYNSKHPFTFPPEVKEKPHSNLLKPGRFEQLKIYLKRDFKGKIANKQYVLLTLLEAPILAFILSTIIRYIPDPDSDVYIFADNENIPIYIFMSLIVALFLGLTISAEEIFRDRKILKRERFLSLSRSSYLLSKVGILIFISAIQTFLFVIIANGILEIRGMHLNYWLALFTTAFCANMLGLNISASFNSAITIYIVIPLLIIPMMVLSGAMFPFDKLNRKIGNIEKVPMIAELMPTRWTYEALIVSQFTDNKYSTLPFDHEGNTYYKLQKKISEANFNMVHRIPALRDALKVTLMEYGSTLHSENTIPVRKTEPHYTQYQLLGNELKKISALDYIPDHPFIHDLDPAEFNPSVADSIEVFLTRAEKIFNQAANNAADLIDRFYNSNSSRLKELEENYYNHSLKELVTKPYERKKVLVYQNNLIQNTDLVYLDPSSGDPINFRTHFFAPSKYIFGIKTDTFEFNITLVLLSTIVLYTTLYFDFLGRIVRFIENLNFRKFQK